MCESLSAILVFITQHCHFRSTFYVHLQAAGMWRNSCCDGPLRTLLTYLPSRVWVSLLPSGGNHRNKFCWAPYYSYSYNFSLGYETPSTKGLNKMWISSYPCNLKMETELTSATLSFVYNKIRTMYKVQEKSLKCCCIFAFIFY